MEDYTITNTPEFSGENVPIQVAAKVMGKDLNYVRQGIQQGVLGFGYALKRDGSSKYDYYISPKLFYEITGYVYKPSQVACD